MQTQRLALLISMVAVVLAAGCYYSQIVSGADAKDFGETVQTRFRYCPICRVNDGDSEGEMMSKAQRLQMYQPDVFTDDGIPILLSFRDTLNDKSWWASMRHIHRRCSISAAGQHLASVEACGKDDFLFYFFPFPVFGFSLGDSPCFRSGHVFKSNRHGSTGDYVTDFHNPPCYDSCDIAMAYGIASRLKEAEDAGRINEISAVNTRAAQSLADAASTRAKIHADSLARHGVAAKLPESARGSPFEIVRCDGEQGKDFAYSFILRRRGGGAITLSDYGIIRNGFRSAIRAHYASSHPNVNPRTLVIDFTDYKLKGDVVCGRVAVLTISPESMTYDSSSRRGVIMVRVGEDQFKDARRWIRRNLASLANRSGISLDGDAVPPGARFYSDSEEMCDGVLKVSFKTE